MSFLYQRTMRWSTSHAGIFRRDTFAHVFDDHARTQLWTAINLGNNVITLQKNASGLMLDVSLVNKS